MFYVSHPDNGWFVELPGQVRIGWVKTSPYGFEALTSASSFAQTLGTYDSRSAAAQVLKVRWETETLTEAQRAPHLARRTLSPRRD